MYKNLIIISSLCFSVVFSPLFASAQGVSGVGSAQVGPAVAMPVKACYTFNRSLLMGSRGADVTELQQFLIGKGFTIPAGATGYFGLQTKAAVANWQAGNGIAMTTNPGSGIFGPLSRGAFMKWCHGGDVATSTQSTFLFTADPESGKAPLSVTFTASASITEGTSTLSVDFGDGTEAPSLSKGSCIAIAAIQGGQGGIRCSYSVAHTYTKAGTYTAQLMHNNCPKDAQCFVGPQSVAKAVVTVASSTTTTTHIEKINAPGSVSLAVGDIAEVRNKSMYFTLTTLTDSKATIQTTGVGCWNWFPSDKPAEVVCMMMVMPVAPQTLGVGESYNSGAYVITLTKIKDNTATFSVGSSPLM